MRREPVDLRPWGQPVASGRSTNVPRDAEQEAGPPTTPSSARVPSDPTPLGTPRHKSQNLGPIPQATQGIHKQPDSHPAHPHRPPLSRKDHIKEAHEFNLEKQKLADLITLSGGIDEALALVSRTRCEQSLYEFVRQAWPYIDSSPFVDSWAIKALCEHLEAVTRGEIRFLLCNFPPRCGKTLVTAVCWPAWTWIQSQRSVTSGPQVRILGASYGEKLSLGAADKMRDLIYTPWFQTRWGEKLKIKVGSDTKSEYANVDGGTRQATSITGRLLGFGGDIIICDDPHNTEGVESEAERENVLRGWHELSSTRLNDPKKSAVVVIMQRLHEEDVSGDILMAKTDRQWVHLMIPMRHDTSRHCITHLPNHIAAFWEDPRHLEGELMWPERFGPSQVSEMEEGLGPYMASGRLQQSPTPKGGGILRREWWQLWPPQEQREQWMQDLPGPDGIVAPRVVYPDFDFIVCSLDTAYTEKDENDFTACTTWGIFADPKTEAPKIMLISAWRDRLTINNLVERVFRTARRKNLEADAVLIENKASGHSVAQELKRLMRPGEFTLHLVDPRKDGGGDKVARMYAAQPSFASSLVYAPDTGWAELVIQECELAPKSKYMDLTDSTTQALIWLRKRGLARMPFEHEEDSRPKLWGGNRQPGLHYGV